MTDKLALIVELIEIEFEGKSWNGPSFMETVDAIDAEAAAFRGTHEGYCAWELVIHCCLYKRFIAKCLGASAPLEPYPWPEANFAMPEKTDEASWLATREYLRKTHKACMDAIRELPAERLDDELPEWKVPIGKAIAWLSTHDTFHGAQIRSMGVPGVRTPKPEQKRE